jgi:predicted nucleotidyltransferase
MQRARRALDEDNTTETRAALAAALSKLGVSLRELGVTGRH